MRGNKKASYEITGFFINYALTRKSKVLTWIERNTLRVSFNYLAKVVFLVQLYLEIDLRRYRM